VRVPFAVSASYSGRDARRLSAAEILDCTACIPRGVTGAAPMDPGCTGVPVESCAETGCSENAVLGEAAGRSLLYASRLYCRAGGGMLEGMLKSEERRSGFDARVLIASASREAELEEKSPMVIPLPDCAAAVAARYCCAEEKLLAKTPRVGGNSIPTRACVVAEADWKGSELPVPSGALTAPVACPASRARSAMACSALAPGKRASAADKVVESQVGCLVITGSGAWAQRRLLAGVLIVRFDHRTGVTCTPVALVNARGRELRRR